MPWQSKLAPYLDLLHAPAESADRSRGIADQLNARLRPHEDRTPTHGYEATREQAMAAFARSWRRE
jgi:hypothetical protein